MKFAVIEYTSKTGRVWRHSDERPNYLADPIKEIDPTSFGCYVSALKGEHVPLLGLIMGSISPASNPLRLYRRIIKKISGRWPRYPLNYLQQFDVILAVHQLSDAHEMVAALQRLKTLQPRPFIIGVPTQPFGILENLVAKDAVVKENLINFIRSVDLFVSVVASTFEWYAKLSGCPVSYLPQPYPVSFTSHYFQSRAAKDKTILVAGVTQRPNIIQGQKVAVALQKMLPQYEIIIPKVEDMAYDFTGLSGSRYRVLPFEPWQQHLATLAKTSLVINTDRTQTRGRVQTDCAAVGTPSIGANSDGQRDLFPDLPASLDTSNENLIAQASRLLTDPAWYEKVVSTARNRLQKYDYEPSAARILALYQKFMRS